MPASRRGRSLPLSPGRRLIVETLHHARKVPGLPLAYTLNVAELAEARAQLNPAPSWFAVFMKAQGIVSRRCPELRRAYVQWPYPRLYEHPWSVCYFPVEREWRGEAVVFGGKVRAPEDQPLPDLDRALRHFKEVPIREHRMFRLALLIARLPWFLNRFAHWFELSFSGYRRARRFGTFTMSTLGNYGVEQMHPLTYLTTYFTFGPIVADGTVVAKLVYDHRVLDGRTVARCLNTLDEVLHTEILAELRSLSRGAAAA
jgi:hypothetical protein